MIPGTVLCDVSVGHVTAGLSPVSWRDMDDTERTIPRAVFVIPDEKGTLRRPFFFQFNRVRRDM